MTRSELTRRLLLKQAAAGPLAMLATGANGAVTQLQVKSSPQTAGYQDRPNGGQRCGNCAQFQPPAACKVVSGRISPQGWCKIYVGRSGA